MFCLGSYFKPNSWICNGKAKSSWVWLLITARLVDLQRLGVKFHDKIEGWLSCFNSRDFWRTFDNELKDGVVFIRESPRGVQIWTDFLHNFWVIILEFKVGATVFRTQMSKLFCCNWGPETLQFPAESANKTNPLYDDVFLLLLPQINFETQQHRKIQVTPTFRGSCFCLTVSRRRMFQVQINLDFSKLFPQIEFSKLCLCLNCTNSLAFGVWKLQVPIFVALQTKTGDCKRRSSQNFATVFSSLTFFFNPLFWKWKTPEKFPNLFFLMDDCGLLKNFFLRFFFGNSIPLGLINVE